MKAYQVLNEYGYPASGDFDDLCIFGDRPLAEAYIDFLNDLDNNLGPFKIREVRVSFMKG